MRGSDDKICDGVFLQKKTKKIVRFTFSTEKNHFVRFSFSTKKNISLYSVFLQKSKKKHFVTFSFSTKKRNFLFYSVFILFFGLGRYSSSRLSRLSYRACILNNLIKPIHFRNKKCLTIRIMFLRKCSFIISSSQTQVKYLNILIDVVLTD
jgi:hypothetical protein